MLEDLVKSNKLFYYEKGKVVLEIVKVEKGENKWQTDLKIQYREQVSARAFFNDIKPAEAQDNDF